MVTGSPAREKLFHCPALLAVRVVAGKWKTRILWLLRERPFHFGELRKTLPGVSAKVLDQQLSQLEQDGLIHRREDMQGGLRYVYYAYSDYGRQLIPVLDSLGEWGLRHDSRSRSVSTQN